VTAEHLETFPSLAIYYLNSMVTAAVPNNYHIRKGIFRPETYLQTDHGTILTV